MRVGQLNSKQDSNEELNKLYQNMCIMAKKKNLKKGAVNNIIDKMKRDHPDHTLKETYEEVLSYINKMS